ncbi:O-succinylhomoserine sulfhydrylase [Magnetospira sp. QH-2]|uniref:O-succinylhomoserine sulfhydrylase n=1 Tax=Magnetospira sp. (strain QH-2) TaxID=1288970 RepID=UPI0003E81C35|nr:O-succinylhomoserine sulfhydrylase [Magnetospira sp. QH-2]CCQ74713.1 Cystathionine gamma-lyase [Magnetospira sp. QH-2]
MKDQDPKNWRPATQAVRGGTRRSEMQETSEALFLTAGYVYDSAEQAEAAFQGEVEHAIYSRFSNPTVTMFEQRVAMLEGAAFCRAAATGMAAATASLMPCVRAGDRVVGSRALFGSCLYLLTDLLPRYGVETEVIDGTDLAEWERALSKPTQAVLVESPSNPGVQIVDIRRVAELTHAAGGKLVVDNAFATPILQRPLEMGADIIFHSSTKYIDGQGRTMGGCVMTNDEAFFNDELGPFMRNTGPTMSPFNAWVQLKGLEHLELRMARHCDNALALAQFLEGQSRITKVLYPGLPSHPQHALAMDQMSNGGGMLALDLAGGKEAAFRFLNGLKLIDISNNLGDAKSLATHPATTTHQRLSDEERAAVGITGGLVRLSVGLEDVNDLKADLEQALKQA